VRDFPINSNLTKLIENFNYLILKYFSASDTSKMFCTMFYQTRFTLADPLAHSAGESLRGFQGSKQMSVDNVSVGKGLKATNSLTKNHQKLLGNYLSIFA
jgi:hypothetical protein